MQKQSYFHWTTASNDEKDFHIKISIKWTDTVTLMLNKWQVFSPSSSCVAHDLRRASYGPHESVWYQVPCYGQHDQRVNVTYFSYCTEVLGRDQSTNHSYRFKLCVWQLSTIIKSNKTVFRIWNDYSAQWKSKEQNIAELNKHFKCSWIMNVQLLRSGIYESLTLWNQS